MQDYLKNNDVLFKHKTLLFYEFYGRSITSKKNYVNIVLGTQQVDAEITPDVTHLTTAELPE